MSEPCIFCQLTPAQLESAREQIRTSHGHPLQRSFGLAQTGTCLQMGASLKARCVFLSDGIWEGGTA